MSAIEVPRSLARRLYPVLRKCYPKANAQRPPAVEFSAGPEGILARVAHPEVSVAYRHPGPLEGSGPVRLPLAALADFEGRTDEPVSLEPAGEGKAAARWRDKGVPRVAEYDVGPDMPPKFPAEPARWAANPPALLAALDEASRTAAKEAVRFALNRVLLRGGTGEVAGTDGRQLLLAGGFSFPWDGDVLAPRLAAFGLAELGGCTGAEAGRTATHLGVRAGPWTFLLAADNTARYPDISSVVPKPGGSPCRWRLHPGDPAFLLGALPGLPGREEENGPVTFDVGEAGVLVRSRAAKGEGPATELRLSRSEREGSTLRACVNRAYLARALRMGFTEFEARSGDDPVVCRSGGRVFLFMPLSKEGVVAPAEDCIRVDSAGDAAPTEPRRERRKPAVPTPPSHHAGASPNGTAGGNGHPPRPPQSPGPPVQSPGEPADLLEEALALRQALRDACERASRLVAAVKRQRQQARLVASTLASLKQLHRLGG